MAMIEAPSTWWCWKENEWRCYTVCLSDCDDLFCSCGLSAISPPHLLFHEAVPFLTVIRYGHLFLFLCPPCKGPVLRVFKLYCFVLLTYSWLHPIFWSFLPSTLLSSWKAVESQSFSLYTKTYYHSSSIMHRLKKNTQVPGTNSYLLMNINFPGFWHRLLSEDWLQEEVEHSFHQFSGLKGSDGLVNGKQAETMTIPRAVRKDKSRSESELPGKMVPTSGRFSETRRDRGDDKASSRFRLHNWHQVADSQAGRGGKGPRQTARLWNGPSAKKILHQLLTVQDPPPASVWRKFMLIVADFIYMSFIPLCSSEAWILSICVDVYFISIYLAVLFFWFKNLNSDFISWPSTCFHWGSLCAGLFVCLFVCFALLFKNVAALDSFTQFCHCWAAKSSLTLCNPMDCSLPVFSVPGVLPARILEWVAISFSIFVINNTLKMHYFYTVLVFIFLAYFTLYDGLQFHPSH